MGLGVSGCSAASFLEGRGWDLVGVDRSELRLRQVEKTCRWRSLLRESELEALEKSLAECRQIVLSPGLDQRHPLLFRARQLNIPVMGELQLGLEALQSEAERAVVAITGSNGKTTVTRLLEHVLRASGRDAIAVGNIGLPLTSCLARAKGAIVIAEISSFQLETLRGRYFDAAALLNITPNHLDRHTSLDLYARLKCQLQRHCKRPNALYTSQSVAEEFGEYLQPPFHTFGEQRQNHIHFAPRRVRVGSQVICGNFLGDRWNARAANFCAVAGLATELGVSAAEVYRASQTFRSPPHRLEWAGAHKGVAYFNDSKATSTAAVMSAVDTLGGSIVLIAGGVHKGSSYRPWIAAFAGRVRCIFAIGQAAPQMRSELSASIPVHCCASLQEAVYSARDLSEVGEKILLSPGCSSFDMFENYEQRGREFVDFVGQIAGEVQRK